MGDTLKLSKDKRHRSSSSIIGQPLEGTRSERKLDIRDSILEVNDQFAQAEARCNVLQEKLDLIKGLKRKKKLKKRSTTQIMTKPLPEEDVPFITVRTQPKRRIAPQSASRTRRLEGPPANPTRGYLDPATVEQHRMLGQVRGYQQPYSRQPNEHRKEQIALNHTTRRAHADGDSVATGAIRRGYRVATSENATCNDEDFESSCFNGQTEARRSELTLISKHTPADDSRKRANQYGINNRRQVTRNMPLKQGNEVEASQTPWRAGHVQPNRRKRLNNVTSQDSEEGRPGQKGRPVVELFYKNNDTIQSEDLTRCNSRDLDNQTAEDSARTTVKEKVPKGWLHRQHVKYRSRGYEQPTVASQMKQSNMRYYSTSPTCWTSSIPFIISKSTAPSHNIGVNIQQVLNGLKNQQPLSGIPLTIAHHMGLGHISPYETKNVQPSLDNREMNVIRLGQRLLRLPSYKFMSYNRLLTMYREGDGMVARFLRSIDRPHQFYSSMYNLATRGDLNGSGFLSKNRLKSKDAKLSLAAYAALYREYEQMNKLAKETRDPELERRKEELIRQLASREEQIRQVVQEYQMNNADLTPLRASASTAEETYRYTASRLHLGDMAQ